MKTETARPTPGPWKWLRHKPNGQDSQWECWLVSDAPIESIPHRDRLIIPMRYDCAAFPYAGTDANARLIAAAPTTTDQLRRTLRALGACRRWVPDDLLPAVNQILTDASLAHNAATGETGNVGDGSTEEKARAAIKTSIYGAGL